MYSGRGKRIVCNVPFYPGREGTFCLQMLLTLEWFSVEFRKTKTKVITLGSHKEHTQYSEPIKTRSNYRKLTQSAGKRVRVSHD